MCDNAQTAVSAARKLYVMNGSAPASPQSIGWFTFSVTTAEGESLAAQLLERANDPLGWSLASFGATIIRRRLIDNDQFLFSPHAVAVFRELIESKGGVGCDPPRARELVPSKTSRMLLGFKTRWESFEPSRTPAQGIPRGKPATPGREDTET